MKNRDGLKPSVIPVKLPNLQHPSFVDRRNVTMDALLFFFDDYAPTPAPKPLLTVNPFVFLSSLQITVLKFVVTWVVVFYTIRQLPTWVPLAAKWVEKTLLYLIGHRAIIAAHVIDLTGDVQEFVDDVLNKHPSVPAPTPLTSESASAGASPLTEDEKPDLTS